MKGKALKSMIILMVAILVVTMMPLTASAATKTPGRAKITSVKVGAVSSTKCTATVTVKWKKVKNATGYQIYGKRYDESWVKIKTVGKNTTKWKIKGVYSGDFDVRVRAIRKKGGKTYKGKFSAVKHKFIPCPITLEQYVKKIGPMQEHAQGFIYESYYRVNTQYDIIPLEMIREDLKNVTAEEFNTPENRADYAGRLALPEMVSIYSKRADFLIGKTGIRNANVVAIVTFRGSEIARHTYKGAKAH